MPEASTETLVRALGSIVADFRRENGPAIQAACAQFVVLCRQLGLFGSALVAIDGSKFKAVNTRDKNFTAYKVKRRIEQVAEHIASYLQDLDTADRHEGDGVEARSVRLVEKVEQILNRICPAPRPRSLCLGPPGARGPAQA